MRGAIFGFSVLKIAVVSFCIPLFNTFKKRNVSIDSHAHFEVHRGPSPPLPELQGDGAHHSHDTQVQAQRSRGLAWGSACRKAALLSNALLLLLVFQLHGEDVNECLSYGRQAQGISNVEELHREIICIKSETPLLRRRKRKCRQKASSLSSQEWQEKNGPTEKNLFI